MHVIYGITDPPEQHGVQAYAIDGETGEIIAKHFCSNESFAKSDLGFSEPCKMVWETDGLSPHCTVKFNDERTKKYAERFPDGYQLEWIGDWRRNSTIIALINASATTNVGKEGSDLSASDK